MYYSIILINCFPPRQGKLTLILLCLTQNDFTSQGKASTVGGKGLTGPINLPIFLLNSFPPTCRLVKTTPFVTVRVTTGGKGLTSTIVYAIVSIAHNACIRFATWKKIIACRM